MSREPSSARKDDRWLLVKYMREQTGVRNDLIARQVLQITRGDRGFECGNLVQWALSVAIP